MSNSNRQFIVACMLMSLLFIVDIGAIRQLTTQDTSVFSMVARLRIPLKTMNHGMLVSTQTHTENAHGLAQIRTMGAFIVVTLSLNGLTPNTTHSASIHVGSCKGQGSVVFQLQPLIADAWGDGTAITVLNVHTLATTRVSIHVDEFNTRATTKMLQGLSVACGDVRMH